jgi:DNA mismatch endonuclease (patch repair protein)
MSAIRGKNTKPEIVVRSALHGAGYRYRIHAKDVPGRPDIVFRRRRKVIFVHGCFWHGHPGCRRAHAPKSRVEYWEPKLAANKARDLRAYEQLAVGHWNYLIVWECEASAGGELIDRLRKFLGTPRQA